MKRIAFLLLVQICTFSCFAQTQQGIVKTRGRIVNGQVVAGQRLTGATITLNIGNPLVSGQNGTFSFNVPSGKNYSLVTAKKQGYTLADPEYSRRSFAYSGSNPFYVVLEDEAQRQADIREATEKVRRTLKREIRKREDELDEMRETNAITQERYDSLRAEFYIYRQKSENLVKEMAERYASTDYDLLDEFNRQVQMYIEEGELQKADSMIRSKGDIEKRVAEYHSVVAANKQEREDLSQRLQVLTQSESGAAKTYEDLSQDLLRRSEIFLQVFQQDSALHCLKMRADLDSMNIEALQDYANLCFKQRKFTECERYYQMCLNLYSQKGDNSNVANIQNDLGLLYKAIHNYSLSEECLKAALINIENLFLQDSLKYRSKLAVAQTNLGLLYEETRNFDKCEYYYFMSFNNTKKMYEQDSLEYREDLAHIQNNLGILYVHIRNYDKAIVFLKLALANKLLLFNKNPDKFRLDLAMTQNNLGNIYRELHDFENSESFYLSALKHKEKLFEQNPDAYRLDFVTTLNGVGVLYASFGNLTTGLTYFIRALENIEILFQENNMAYREDLSSSQNNLGNIYMLLKNYELSEKYYDLSLRNLEILYKQYPKTYNFIFAMTKANLGYLYALKEYYDKSTELLDESITMLPNEANLYDTKGEILLMQGKNEEALAMWKKVIELNPDFLKENPDGTELSNGLKKLGLIE